ncbi:50S ribosomal protein L37ae [Candidatus Woesearchaeota archaeon]|nr:50S ribosomal protein L37ae [Candidatus Woesearchaeota archaeon]
MGKATNRYGVRYGKTTKLKVEKIEKFYRNKKQKCPYCKKAGVKRLAAGIWQCQKCNNKFAGKAYSFSQKMIAREEEE